MNWPYEECEVCGGALMFNGDDWMHINSGKDDTLHIPSPDRKTNA
jgi:hypothetical protein